MDLWNTQDNWAVGDWRLGAEPDTETIAESDTIDLDYFGLTDDEIRAFDELYKDMYYEYWLDYVSGWD